VPRKRTTATLPDPQEPVVPPQSRDEGSSFQGHPATRMRAADYVFETLSRAILVGELPPGSVLATQRALSQQFGVSPLVVRQATHRLEELGLVRVRQGSTTIVLDPNEAGDLRLTQLQLELATPGDRLSLAAREMQSLSTLPLLTLAERRIQEEDLEELETLIDSLPAQPNTREQLTFRRQFWGRVALATRNPILEHQIRWWARVMKDIEGRNTQTMGASEPPLAPPTIYKGLIRAMRRRRGTVEYWLKVIEPLFDYTEAQPNHTINSARTPPAKRARIAH
jgi:DNA-binding FadR family transcriptional regulator